MTVSRACVIAGVTLLASLPSQTALAGQTSANGSIRGYVRDVQGGILPGVTVTAASQVAGGTQSTVTDAGGYYRLLNVPPGEYVLTAELQGFAKFVRAGLAVRAGLNIGVDVVLSVGNLAETVEVKADTPMLEVATTSQAVNISGELQRALPTSSRRQWIDFLLVTPGAVESNGAQRSLFYVHGSDFGSHVIQFDGADIAAPVQSSNLYVFMSNEAVDDVQVKTGGIDASAPLGQGAVMNIAMQSGTNQFKGNAGLVLQRRGWSSNNNPGGTTSAYDLVQPDAAAGGPVRKDRVWAFGSYRASLINQSVSRTAGQLAALEALVPGFKPPETEFDGAYAFIKGTARLTANHQLQSFYHYGMDRRSSVAATSEKQFRTDRVGGDAVSAALSSVWGPAATTRIGVWYNNQSNPGDLFSYNPTGRQVHASAILSSGRLVGTGIIAQLDNQMSGQTAPAEKLTVTADATYFHRGWVGSHELKGGVYVQPTRLVDFGVRYANGGFALEEHVLRNAANPAAGTVAFHRAIYDREFVTSTRVNSRDYAFYAQDAWRPSERLTVNGGLRVDFISRRDEIFDVVMQDTTAVDPGSASTICSSPMAGTPSGRAGGACTKRCRPGRARRRARTRPASETCTT